MTPATKEGGSKAAAVVVALAAACLAVCRPSGDAGTVGASSPETAAPASQTRGATEERGADRSAATPTPVRRLVARVVASYPHDASSYTQGLELAGGVLYESAGQYGESSVRRVELETGDVLLQRDLPPDLFAEGLTLVPAAAARPARLIQLTWREGRALVWEPSRLEPAGEHAYQGQGWGLCLDGEGPDGPRLVMSDGSAYLTFRDPVTFAVTGGVPVTLGSTALAGLNELECVGGSAWANVYPTDRIVEVDLATGRVSATADASGLLSPVEAARADVLNGIAHDPADGTFLLTGKYWPRLFRVVLVER